MDTGRETFRKQERLCSRKIITELFESGNIFYLPLFKIVWRISTAEMPFPAQVAFSVSKKGFRHAVTRNLLKRRMREAYRKNKKILYEFLNSKNTRIVFIIIFRGDSVVDSKIIEKSINDLMERFTDIILEQEKC